MGAVVGEEDKEIVNDGAQQRWENGGELPETATGDISEAHDVPDGQRPDKEQHATAQKGDGPGQHDAAEETIGGSSGDEHIASVAHHHVD